MRVMSLFGAQLAAGLFAGGAAAAAGKVARDAFRRRKRRALRSRTALRRGGRRMPKFLAGSAPRESRG